MTYKTAQNNTTDLYSRMGLAKQSNFPITFRENTVKIWVHGLLPLKDINIKKRLVLHSDKTVYWLCICSLYFNYKLLGRERPDNYCLRKVYTSFYS